MDARVNPVIECVPVRARPDPGAGRGVAVALRRAAVRGQLGLGIGDGGDGQRKAEASYDIPDAERTPSLNWSAYSLRKLWNQGKNITAPWWAENSKEAYSSGVAILAGVVPGWRSPVTTPRRRGPTP